MHLPDAHGIVQALSSGVLLGAIYGISALGLALVLGVLRLVNLSHGDGVVLGSYLGYVLLEKTGMNPLLGLCLILPVVALLAYAIERILLAPLRSAPSEASLLTTLGLSVIMQNAFILLFSADTHTIAWSYGVTAFHFQGIAIPRIYLLGFVLALALTGAIYWLIHGTSLGRQIRASSEDPMAAAITGVSVDSTYALTFALGACCATVGGILAGTAFAFTPATGTMHLLTGFEVVVLGGLGSVTGALAGGISIGVIESLGAAVVGDGYREFIGLVVFLLFLALRPQGIFGRAQR